MSAIPRPSRYSTSERAADRTIHLAGLVLGLAGTSILLGIAARSASPMVLVTSLIYPAALMAMLVCSTLYHHSTQAYRLALRRLDHAAIFILIAGTYTPFTACRLHGMWAVALTAAVWVGALGGTMVKAAGAASLQRPFHRRLCRAWLDWGSSRCGRSSRRSTRYR